MNYEEEIHYRNEIMTRVYRGERATAEETLWLATHKLFNWQLGYPYLNADIVQLKAKENYRIKIEIEYLSCANRIIPVITVPGGKGKIITDFQISDYNGNVTTGRPVRMLGVTVSQSHSQTEICYQSDLGLLGISYQCDYFDNKHNLLIRKDSITGDPSFAMIREVLSDNKMLYRCKLPTSDSFDSLVFSIQWISK